MTSTRPWDTAPTAHQDTEPTGADYLCTRCATWLSTPGGRCPRCSPRVAGDGPLVGVLVAVLLGFVAALADRVEWSTVPEPVRALAGLLLVLAVTACAGAWCASRYGKRDPWAMRYGAAP